MLNEKNKKRKRGFIDRISSIQNLLGEECHILVKIWKVLIVPIFNMIVMVKHTFKALWADEYENEDTIY